MRKTYILENKNKYFCFLMVKINFNKEKYCDVDGVADYFFEGGGGGGRGRVVKLTVKEKIKQVLRESATLA